MERNMTMETSDPTGLTMAKWLADRGAKVIPAYVSMKTGDKLPMCKDWANVATRSYEQLERWWNDKPWCHPGVVSGRDSWLCFDVDGPDAVNWFRAIYSRYGGPGEVEESGRGCNPLIYRTPGRTEGLHVWFSWPDWLADLHSVKYREPDWNGEVQLRGRGCWTLIAGAKRPEGEYEMLVVPEGPICEAPRELVVAFMQAGEQTTVAAQGDLRELSPEAAWAGAPWQDNRKTAVAGLAWHMAIRGVEESEYWDTLYRFAEECCVPSLDQNIVKRKGEYTWNRALVAREKQTEELTRMGAWAAKLLG